VNLIRFRDAKPGDAAAIGALHVASWRETYAGLLPDAMLAALSVEARTAMWRQILADPGAFGDAAVFVAEEAGSLVGFGSCGRQRDAALAEAGYGGEIGAVYVLRAHQQRGAGRALMGALARALAEQGHAGASLWVLRENMPARLFYEELGGALIGQRHEEQPGASFVELAYGWRDLSALAR
jgi:GNAT superfamily N-acetyltransferase